MKHAKEELVAAIEQARARLNESIDSRQEYEKIYRESVELDRLIELYVGEGD